VNTSTKNRRLTHANPISAGAISIAFLYLVNVIALAGDVAQLPSHPRPRSLTLNYVHSFCLQHIYMYIFKSLCWPKNKTKKIEKKRK